MKGVIRRIFFTAAALAVVAGAVLGILRFGFYKNHCDRFESLLAAGPNGKLIVYKFEACTALATTVDAHVDLVSQSSPQQLGRHLIR